jgi:hypothetical protein
MILEDGIELMLLTMHRVFLMFLLLLKWRGLRMLLISAKEYDDEIMLSSNIPITAKTVDLRAFVEATPFSDF